MTIYIPQNSPVYERIRALATTYKLDPSQLAAGLCHAALSPAPAPTDTHAATPADAPAPTDRAAETPSCPRPSASTRTEAYDKLLAM